MATINEMRQVATQIKTETQVGGNTASRVGGLFNDIVDELERQSTKIDGNETVIKIRRNTSTGFASENPILADGELGFETDRKRYKMGDGVTAWNSLEYRSEELDATPTQGSTNGVTSGGVFEDTRRSSSNIRGLDFSSYTGDVEGYTKGIIFIGVVLANGYTPNEKPKIYALCKKRNGDNLFRLWLITEIGGNEHKIQGSFDLSTLSKSNDGIAYLKATGALGTMYAIVNINAYSDGEIVKFGAINPLVEVNTILATDSRILDWGGEINLSTLRSDVNTLNSSVPQLSNYVNINEAEIEKIESLTLIETVGQSIEAIEIFKGFYNSNGSLNTSYSRYSALYPVENNKVYLYTNIKYPSVGIAGYDVAFLDENRNFVSGIVRGTQPTYVNYPISISNNSIKYIAAISGPSPNSNASSLALKDWQNKFDEPMSDVQSQINIIQSQFRNLDFSNFENDVNPYCGAILFAAAVRTGEKPEWQLDKVEIYALGYNQNNNDRIEVGFYIGEQSSTVRSIWFRTLNVSQLDDIPNIQCVKASNYDTTIYLIYSPKYLYDYYQKYHASIIYGGTVGKRVCIENLLDSDPRIQAFNVNANLLALKTELESEIASLSSDDKFWKNKKLVWYGTSIPAGSDPTLDQEGIGITYPNIAATYIGATCNNEAVGSGRASYLAPVQNETYQHLMRCQGGTIASKLALFNDIYVIDDDNETVTLGPNTYNVGGLPVSGTPTYAQAVSLRLEAIRFSYEIKLISRYLDSTNQYLQDVLNSQEVAANITYSGTGYELLHCTDMDYMFTPELFVFDHGTNDYGHMSNNDDVTSRDTTKFYGAMNMMYDLIQFYAPTSLVCIVTDYGTSRYNSDLVINEQQAWANYWQIPCLRTCDIVPWNGTMITVQGYWDGGTAQGGQWHNEGFYFTVDGNAWKTNNGIILRKYSSSTPASTIINAFNIRTIKGKQVYDIQQKYKFFKDGLHPHTDTSGNALKLYARNLSRLISTQVVPNSD